MNRKNLRGVPVLVLALTAIASVSAAQTYSITDLGVLPGDSASQGLALNSSGQVVGCSDTSTVTDYPCGETFPGHAFLWSSSTGMQDLGVLHTGDVFSEALNITDSGQVTGTSVSSSGDSYPFLWTHGTGMKALPTLPGATYGFSGSINSQGTIYGSGNSGANPSTIIPISWIKNGSSYKIQKLPVLPSAVITLCCYANNSSEETGLALLNAEGTSYHAFLIKNTSVKDLGTLPGGALSNANGINSSGDVSGYSTSATSGSNWIAVFWDAAAKIHSLGTLSGGNSSAGYGINDSNQIVGFSSTATSTSDAMIWSQKTGMQDLNSLIPANSGWVLELAVWINNAGQITGYGTINGQNHAFLLTPVS
jgi:probable HAF family extracellular repeat protein